MADEETQFYYLCISVVLFVAVILYSQSWKALSPLQYGILENTITRTIDKTKVYKNGRWYTGIGNSFVVFPGTAQFIDITFSGFTADQNPVTGGCSLQYVLKNTKDGELIGIYERFLNSQFDSFFRQTATEILKQALNKYKYTEYFTMRETIEDNIASLVRDSFSKKHAIVTAFQLLEIDFGDSTDDTIVSKMVAGQRTRTTQVQQQSAQVRAETGKIQGFAQAEIKVTQAQATNEASRASIAAASSGQKIVLEKVGETNAALKQNLQLSSAQLKVFKFNEQLRDRSNKDSVNVDLVAYL